jgi:hypothetical protein
MMKISPRISFRRVLGMVTVLVVQSGTLGVVGGLGGLAARSVAIAAVMPGQVMELAPVSADSGGAGPVPDAQIVRCAPLPSPPALTESAPPRLELSYRRFSLRNLDLTSLPVSGVELDMYPLSTDWVRAGLELEAGAGSAGLDGHTLDARYGLFGLVSAVQYPGLARVTPFLAGRLFGGVLGGRLDGPITLPGTTVTLIGTSAVTWLYGGGLDLGANVFALGRSHLSLALGWVHTTWGGVDYVGALATPSIGVRFKNLTEDSLTIKLGLGI